MYIKTIKQLISNIKSKQSKIYFTLKIKNILNEIDVDILSAILFKLVCLFFYWPVCILNWYWQNNGYSSDLYHICTGDT